MKTTLDRFEEKFIPEALSGCWLWSAAQHQFGYGHFLYNKKVHVAHRVSYELYVGKIPDGMCVLHRCDVPECVNPAHLFLGTTQDNIKDKCKKGRQRGLARPGNKNPAAKLSLEQVNAIRADNGIYQIIADKYCVSRSAIKKIKTGKTWSAM